MDEALNYKHQNKIYLVLVDLLNLKTFHISGYIGLSGHIILKRGVTDLTLDYSNFIGYLLTVVYMV